MTDFALEWHSDFQVSSTGGLLLVDGDAKVRQRLQRRLFTAVQGYVWHPDYGAGLPQKIGDTYSSSQIQSIVQAQLNLEASVAPNPPAQLTVSQNVAGTIIISIQYYDAITGVSVSFQITT